MGVTGVHQHSQAKGHKRQSAQPDLFGETLPDEAAERSRATMWDVPRFAEHHGYRAVIVENVVDAARWVMWPAWLQRTAVGDRRGRYLGEVVSDLDSRVAAADHDDTLAGERRNSGACKIRPWK